MPFCYPIYGMQKPFDETLINICNHPINFLNVLFCRPGPLQHRYPDQSPINQRGRKVISRLARKRLPLIRLNTPWPITLRCTIRGTARFPTATTMHSLALRQVTFRHSSMATTLAASTTTICSIIIRTIDEPQLGRQPCHLRQQAILRRRHHLRHRRLTDFTTRTHRRPTRRPPSAPIMLVYL